MIRIILFQIALTLMLGVSVTAQERPFVEVGTQMSSDSPSFRLLGYERRQERFWVVADSQTLSIQSKDCKIVKMIFCHFRQKFNLDSADWSIVFFTDSSEAGYKTFKSTSFLAEYIFIKNRITLYPTIHEWQRWFHGPADLRFCK
jgi:hypothetical protein